MRKKAILLRTMGATVALLFFLVWNMPPLRAIATMMGLEPLIHSYHYQTADGTYRDDECPEKGRDLQTIEREFEAHKVSRARPEVVLYRTSTRDWWRVWLWHEYLTHPRWKYPYRANVGNALR